MKYALVTGGSRGIGRTIAETLSREGYKTIILYNSSMEKAKELEKEGIVTLKCDVGNREEVRRVKQQVEELTDKLHVLVNNAGLWYLMPFEKFDEEKYEKMLRVNLNGVIYMTYELLPLLKNASNASIVNIASNAGIGTAAEGTTFYAVTKAGVIILTRRLAFELGKYGIRVNAVAPGWIETDMTIGGKSEEEVEKLREYFRNKTVLHTTGKPEDVAHVVSFLVSEKARYITGQVIVVDGGRIDNLTHSV
ncbi:SDR family oxidoreductase [Stygiolobus sp. CP859M]|uniref:SDR family oxidoreductase n=1 Tax=Stygiolobus sp. CP859M TaxID=3133135 RepID=UPI00307E3B78